ncbi:MAG: sensor histidine kinase [Chitinophaga sp.]|uniref:sensor histidine kinase n=1 Tax=Chitinophaga sp. TaxID=1869181 RepID=UPI0025C08819|nr:sensor histidine kinase [Chitinophaga sp.]MBV8253970.1 sensor histidine kinase [Chitinophaga sp.]
MSVSARHNVATIEVKKRNSLTQWIASGAFDKFYTPKVRIATHVCMWILLYILHIILVRSNYVESLPVCLLFAFRNILCIAFSFYFLMYLVIPKWILKGKFLLGIIGLMMPLVVYSLTSYLVSLVVLKYLTTHNPYVSNLVKQIVSDGLISKAAMLRMVRSSWAVLTAILPCIVAKLGMDTLRNITRTLRLEKDRLDMELNFLKAQLNPHFLFNTLNNIYMLSLKGAEQAPDLILHLSEMMRYTLYESDTAKVDLQHEVAFMRNYTELERVRYGAKANIVFDYNETEITDQQISPLLMFPFLENAFKYGHVGPDGKCHVIININANGQLVTMSVSNSKNEASNQPKELGGIGQANSRKRLELLYPGKYTLDIKDEGDIYSVKLSINLN